jgi:hypothetical protein
MRVALVTGAGRGIGAARVGSSSPPLLHAGRRPVNLCRSPGGAALNGSVIQVDEGFGG